MWGNYDQIQLGIRFCDEILTKRKKKLFFDILEWDMTMPTYFSAALLSSALQFCPQLMALMNMLTHKK